MSDAQVDVVDEWKITPNDYHDATVRIMDETTMGFCELMESRPSMCDVVANATGTQAR